MDVYLTEVLRDLASQSWQIAGLTLVVGAATWALRHRTAHVRYLLWLLVLAKCLVPPFVAVPLKVLPEKAPPLVLATVPVAEPMMREPVAPDYARRNPERVAQIIATGTERAAPKPWTLATCAGLTWIGGAGLFLALNLLRALRGQHWLHRRRRPLPDAVRAQMAVLLAAYKGRSLPSIWVIDEIGQPFVWGLLRGSIYVPSRFLEIGDPEHRRHVLAHELSHVLRCDAAVNALQTLAQGLFWFHPFVWWTNRQIRREREKCCDEMAVALSGTQARDYCHAVVETLARAETSARPVPSLAVAGPARNLEERIKAMLTPGKRFYKRPSLATASIIVLAAFVTVPTALVLTARAQTEPSKARTGSPETLYEAAAAGDLEQVKKLLAQGADVHAKDKKGQTPLHSAAWYGRKDVTAVLLAHGANVNETDGSGKTPLHSAANYGEKAVPELLLAQGAQIDARDDAGNTPLHAAANRPVVTRDLLELLIAKGADVMARNEAGQTPLHRVAMIKRQDIRLELTAEVFLAHGAQVDAKDNSGCTPLYFAVESGYKELVDLLVAKGADVRTTATDGTTLLHQAAKSGRLEMVERFLSRGIDVNSASSDGRTALHVAADADTCENSIVEALIARGADVKARDVRGETPAQVAVRSNHKDTVRLLLDKGAEVSTIHIAAYIGDLDAVKGFLEQRGNVTAQDKYLTYTLMIAAQGGQKDVVDFLISKGGSVNVEDVGGGFRISPLHMAARSGAKDLVSLLIDQGADINAEFEVVGEKEKGKARPLDFAMWAGQGDMAKLLIDKGADISSPDEFLYMACEKGDKDLAELLIQKGANVNSKAWGYPPVMDAIWCGYWGEAKPADAPRFFGVVKALLDHGADPDGKDRGSHSLLFYACKEFDLAKLLLDKGASPNAVANDSGQRPLHWAADRGCTAVAELLISRGADVNATDNRGRTALSYAEDLGDTDMSGQPRKTPLTPEAKAAKKETAEVLRKHGAKE